MSYLCCTASNACLTLARRGLYYFFYYCVWPIIKGIFSLQNGLFLLWFNTYSTIYFLGIRDCDLPHSLSSDKHLNANFDAIMITMLLVFPATLGQFRRYYNELCKYFDKTEGIGKHKFWSYIGYSTSFIQTTCACFTGYNAIGLMFAGPDENLPSEMQCHINPGRTHSSMSYALSSIFAIFMALASIKHEALLFAKKEILKCFSLPATALSFSFANILCDLFPTIHALSKDRRDLHPTDIINICLLVLSVLIIIPYRMASFLEEYSTILGTRISEDDATQQTALLPANTHLTESSRWQRCQAFMWKFWEDNIKPSRATALLVTAAVWYVCIYGVIKICSDLRISPEKLYTTLSISTGLMAATCFFIRFLVYMRPSP